MRVSFTTSFEHPVSGTDTKVWPAGWQGEVADGIAAKAIKAGAAVSLDAPAAEQAAEAPPAPKPKAKK